MPRRQVTAARRCVSTSQCASEALIGSVPRLTVDTWAVQHPGRVKHRRGMQWVGSQLSRLMLRLDSLRLSAGTNRMMLYVLRHMASLPPLPPPVRFTLTVADMAPSSASRSTPGASAPDPGGTTASGAVLAAVTGVGGLLERKPSRLATVAIANKTARIAWALLVRGASYKAAPAI